MWSIDPYFASKTQAKKFKKRFPCEFKSCFSNLQKVLDELNDGRNLLQIDYGFFRHEKAGVYRIGQSEIEHPHETRLYVSFDEESKIVYNLGIGEKNGQSKDIARHVKTVKEIKKAKECKKGESARKA